MKKYISFFLFLFVCFTSSFVFAVNGGASVGGNSIYQLFINNLRSTQAGIYSQYLTNGTCYIVDVSSGQSVWYINNNKYGGIYYHSASNNSYINDPATSNVHIQYICFITQEQTPVVYNTSSTYTWDSVTYNLDYSIGCASYTNTCRIGLLLSDGTVTWQNMQQPIKLGANTSVVWTDDKLPYFEPENNGYFMESTSNTYIEPTIFDFNGNWGNYELYEYLIQYINHNYNYYANVWACGNNPTCAIFDNSNSNIVANKLNSNYVASDYLAVLYPDRLCSYIQNNNSEHFNVFTLQQQLLYIYFNRDNSIEFAYMGRVNTQQDIATIVGMPTGELLFTNKNIIKKSNSNNFVLDGDNFTYSYTTSYDNQVIVPVAPIHEWQPDFVGPVDIDLSSIENYIDDVEDNQTSILNTITSFFNTFWDNLLSGLASLWETTTETVEAVFLTVKNSISQFLPIRLFNDFTGMFESIMIQADMRSRSLDPRLEFTFLEQDYSVDFLYFYKIHKNQIRDYIKFFLVLSCAYYNINQMFIVLGARKIF